MALASYPHENLFRFEWARDKHGYEIGEAARSPTFQELEIRPKGGPLEFYRPLEQHPGLFRRFANIKPVMKTHHPTGREYAESHDTDEILAFANEFGLLNFFSPHPDEDDLVEFLDNWSIHIGAMSEMVTLLDADQNHDAAEEFNSWADDDDGGTYFLAKVKLTPSKKSKRIYMNVSPVSLLSCMLLQLAEEITNNITYKKCKFCPNWFPFGPGTGHKRIKKFCSTRCRVAWNRQRKRAIV